MSQDSHKSGSASASVASTISTIVAPSPDAITEAAQRITTGRLVAFPTETVYGLGADATSPTAVARVFDVKQRPAFNPLIVHVADIDQAQDIVEHWPAVAHHLAQCFWPGGLTIVLPRRAGAVADLVTAGLPTVALRMPDHPVALALLGTSGVPIAAPSANRFGTVSPTTAQHVAQSLGDRVDCILDGGPCRAGVESTVLTLATDTPTLLRPGAVALEEIEALIGPVHRAGSSEGVALGSPGMLRHHYATRTPLYMAGTQPGDLVPNRTGHLVLSKSPREWENATVEVLSVSGDLVEAAANLFAAMRRLDDADLDAIVAQRVPDTGLGLAINDRITRAAVTPKSP